MARVDRVALLQSRIRRILELGGQRFVARMQRERLSGPTGPSSLSRRTGELARHAIQYTVTTGQATMRLVVWVSKSVPYARIHEMGGTVRPKTAKFLAIPLAAAKTRAGVARMRPRDIPNLKFVPRRGKSPLLVLEHFKNVKVKLLGKTIRTDKIVTKSTPMFVLKRSVTIPARMGFRQIWGQERGKIAAEVRAAVADFRRQRNG